MVDKWRSGKAEHKTIARSFIVVYSIIANFTYMCISFNLENIFKPDIDIDFIFFW